MRSPGPFYYCLYKALLLDYARKKDWQSLAVKSWNILYITSFMLLNLNFNKVDLHEVFLRDNFVLKVSITVSTKKFNTTKVILVLS